MDSQRSKILDNVPSDLRSQIESNLNIAGPALLAVVGLQLLSLTTVACQCVVVERTDPDEEEASRVSLLSNVSKPKGFGATVSASSEPSTEVLSAADRYKSKTSAYRQVRATVRARQAPRNAPRNPLPVRPTRTCVLTSLLPRADVARCPTLRRSTASARRRHSAQTVLHCRICSTITNETHNVIIRCLQREPASMHCHFTQLIPFSRHARVMTCTERSMPRVQA